MNEIKDIYKVKYLRNEFSYCGLLRNEKKFNINDNVFFSKGYKGEIFKGRIIGVELPPDQNPEYIYKIMIPEEYCQENENKTFTNIICDKIFASVNEAKESAIENLEHLARIQRKEIDRYFKQFEK